MSELPFMPIWVNRFMGGTAGMTGEQRALYLMLLVIQWASGPLPEDFNEIAQLVGYNEKTFKRLWSRIAPKFQKLDDSGLINVTLEKIRIDSLERQKGNIKRASAGGKAKAAKNSKPVLRILNGGASSSAWSASSGSASSRIGCASSSASSLLSQSQNPEVREEAYDGRGTTEV